MNAMRSPLGDHAAWPSLSPLLVRRRGPPPKVDSSHKLDAPLFSAMSKRVTEHTACAPSGDSDKPPMRSICHSASTSIVLLFFLFFAISAVSSIASADAIL